MQLLSTEGELLPLPTAPPGSCLFCRCPRSPGARCSRTKNLLRVADQAASSDRWTDGRMDGRTHGPATGSPGRQGTGTLPRRGSPRPEKQKQCCFQIREVNPALYVRNAWPFPQLSSSLEKETPQNHRIVGVGRDLCGSSSPTLLPKQGHLQQAAQDLVQAGLEYL